MAMMTAEGPIEAQLPQGDCTADECLRHAAIARWNRSTTRQVELSGPGYPR